MERLTNEGRHHLLLSLKQMHERVIENHSMHAHINRARLSVFEVGKFLREVSQLSRTYTPTPLLRSHLSLSPMGVFSRDGFKGVLAFSLSLLASVARISASVLVLVSFSSG